MVVLGVKSVHGCTTTTTTTTNNNNNKAGNKIITCHVSPFVQSH